MAVEILILAGMVHLTAPATPEPQQYMATAYALPGVSLAWRGWDGWVTLDRCYDRCNTAPAEPARMLRGEFSVRELADLQLTVWRREGSTWVQVMHCNHFFTGPVCADWGR